MGENDMSEWIVFAYLDGPDTSVPIPWIKEKNG